MTDHVIDELPALLVGQLPAAAAEAVLDHLRDCPGCTAALQDTLRGHAALTRTARLLGSAGLVAGVRPASTDVPALPDSSTTAEPTAAHLTAAEPTAADLPPLLLMRPHRRPRRFLAAAAAPVVLAAGAAAGGTYALTRPHSAAAPVVLVAAELHPVPGGTGPAGAGGRITMTAGSNARQMTVTVRGLPSAGSGRFYEVWLFRPVTGKMLPVGVLTPAGRGEASFSVPAGIAAGYTAVDISLEPDNGNPAHSADSVLRAQLSS